MSLHFSTPPSPSLRFLLLMFVLHLGMASLSRRSKLVASRIRRLAVAQKWKGFGKTRYLSYGKCSIGRLFHVRVSSRLTYSTSDFSYATVSEGSNLFSDESAIEQVVGCQTVT